MHAKLQEDPDKKSQKPEATYSAVTNGAPQTSKDKYDDLTSALRLNNPSRSEHKMPNDSTASHDPILDHVISSHAFKCVVWCFLAALIGVGLAVLIMNNLVLSKGEYMYEYPDYRSTILLKGGLPAFLGIIPIALMCVLPFSRRLR